MFNPVDRSKSMVKRALLRQLLATSLVAVMGGFVAASGVRFGFGIMVGGIAVMLGNLLASRIALASEVVPANVVLMRWFMSVIVRWSVFLAVMVGAVAVWKLPPLALLLGVLVALVTYMVSVSFQTVRNRT